MIGFPDDETSSWAPVFTNFEKDHRILSVCMPGFEDDALHKRWGYDFNTIIDMLHATITDKLGDADFTLLIHDWGSYIGMLYQDKYPNHVKSVVIADVMVTDKDQADSLYKTLVVMNYQLLLAATFVTHELLGKAAGGVALAVSIILLKLLPFLSPTPKDRIPRDVKKVGPHMCYPYYHIWKDIVSGTIAKPSLPACPVLYLWGTEKNIKFHDDAVVEGFKNKANSKVVSYKCGHWIMHYCTDAVNREIAEFLKKVF
jgi:pimeloyl-ACP methyl ester carboxylesterase